MYASNDSANKTDKLQTIKDIILKFGKNDAQMRKHKTFQISTAIAMLKQSRGPCGMA